MNYFQSRKVIIESDTGISRSLEKSGVVRNDSSVFVLKKKEGKNGKGKHTFVNCIERIGTSKQRDAHVSFASRNTTEEKNSIGCVMHCWRKTKIITIL